MRKPYLKKYGTLAGFTVWIVNGTYIRQYLNEEFTNFGQHYRFHFIPRHEFWIDKEYSERGEENYYIDHLLVEYRLMSEGKDYYHAVEAADRIERRERSKSRLLQQMKKEHKHPLKQIYKCLLKKALVQSSR